MKTIALADIHALERMIARNRQRRDKLRTLNAPDCILEREARMIRRREYRLERMRRRVGGN